MKWDPDSGSDCCIISLHHVKEYEKQQRTKIKLRPVTKIITAANGTFMQFKGFFIASLSSASNTITTKIYVQDMPQQEPPLLNEKSLLELGLMKYCPNGSFVKKTSKSVSVPQIKSPLNNPDFQAKLDALHVKYAAVYNGIGRLKNFKADIRLTEDAVEFYHKAIPIPVHLKLAVEERIAQYVRDDLFEKVPPNKSIKYCSSILPVLKEDKSVRICANFIFLNRFI